MFVCGHITRFNQQANRVRTLIPIHQTSSLRPIKGLLALEPVGWIQTIIYHHILSFSYRYKLRRGEGGDWLKQRKYLFLKNCSNDVQKECLKNKVFITIQNNKEDAGYLEFSWTVCGIYTAYWNKSWSSLYCASMMELLGLYVKIKHQVRQCWIELKKRY